MSRIFCSLLLNYGIFSWKALWAGNIQMLFNHDKINIRPSMATISLWRMMMGEEGGSARFKKHLHGFVGETIFHDKLSTMGKRKQTDENHNAGANIYLALVQRTINFSCYFGVCVDWCIALAMILILDAAWMNKLMIIYCRRQISAFFVTWHNTFLCSLVFYLIRIGISGVVVFLFVDDGR